ncbi:MAG: UDP-N-acetylmuramoyl-L-alanine--D-glutamate ligase [Oscillospiraceae bacterium]
MNFSAQTFFPSMHGRRIDVIGVGVSNTELIFRLAQSGAEVTLCDRKPQEQLDPTLLARLRKAGVSLRLGPKYLDEMKGEIIFRTPGLSFTTSALSTARARGQVVTSELEVFLQLCPCRVFGVTGSDGKTTTSSILAAILRKTGRTVHLGGNIGAPLLPLVDRVHPDDYCVVELSSFQLLSMRCSPDIAILTNITPNHLDVHGTMEEYIAAKCNILDHQDAFSHAILSRDNPPTAALSSHVRGRLSWFSRQELVTSGAWMDRDGNLWHSDRGQTELLVHRQEVLLPGLHNIENLLAATSAAWDYVPVNDIAAVAREFPGVEHRIEFVRNVGGVKWYNDSIATSPTRTIAGLLSFDQKLIVIAGGYDKQIPFEPLAEPLIEHAKALILTGATADRIEQAVRAGKGFSASGLAIWRVDNLEAAVAKAASIARVGDIVTLSPACASFDAFPNFEARGQQFKTLVSSL